ncbi:MAG: hypothetical protein CMP10_10525 [Zetaproteobacteria bacterium]|nr:hypothetical protein [Pseudobdellovibrionaceae bacterium]
MNTDKTWHDCTVINLENKPDGYRFLRLKTPVGWQHKPGQYTIFNLKDSEGTFKAYYSIASDIDHSGEIDFCIHTSPESRSGKIYDHLQPGDTLPVAPAQGNFELQESTKPKIFIAGGSGIAPIRAMVQRELQKSQSNQAVHLIYGCRSGNHIPYANDFKSLSSAHDRFSFTFCAETTDNNEYVKKGMVTDFLTTAIIENCEYYLCGPKPMLEAVVAILETANVAETDIYMEKY